MGVSGRRLEPDAVITLGEWVMHGSGERGELVCFVMRRAGPAGELLEVLRPELLLEVCELALFVLEVWRDARGLGS